MTYRPNPLVLCASLAVLVLCSGCLTNPFKPRIEGQNLEIAENAIQGSIKGVEAGTHIDGIAADADQIAENAADIESETEAPLPCLGLISDDAAQILSAVDRLKERLHEVERLNRETAELLKRISHQAQGKRYLSPFMKFMIYLVIFIVIMLALKRTAFFPIWSRAVMGLANMFMDGMSGALEAGKDLAATVADAVKEIDNDSLPPAQQIQIIKTKAKADKAKVKKLQAEIKANGS